MLLKLYRFSTSDESTLGLLFVNDVFYCYTLEDTHNDIKIKGETRIPKGTYEIKYRTVGGFHGRYLKRFSGIHKGMLELQNVPNFKYILIHCGNTIKDTDGCILVGDVLNNNTINNGFLGNSANAYKRLYKVVSRALDKGEEVLIHIYEAK